MSVELCFQFRNRIKQVCNKAKISHLENRGFFILVDGHNHLAVLHAGKVLDRTRDTNRHIKIRRHNLASLANLIIIWHKPGIDCRA